ncbi:TadE/TadG family type IV pilus assembly protein (plasmid) [Acetobacter orientalis]|uniref:TadE/TadG family type IV pilus assembly protein n=1 Tax=Acetobacter orientalis TaxID=146474 RepID=UPI00386DBB95
MRIRETFLAISQHKKGSISIEFALLLPLMVMFFVGTASLLNIISCYQKVHVTARAVADMVAQNGTATMKADEIDGILKTGILTLWPFDASQARITVTSFVQEQSGVPKVLWSRGSEPRGKNSTYPVLDGFSSQRSTSFIYSEVKYNDSYIVSTIFDMIKTSVLSAEITMTPRNVDVIECSSC